MTKRIVLAALFAGSCVYGANIQPFVGIDVNKIEASKMKIDWATDDNNGVRIESGKDILPKHKDDSYGIKVGANIDNNHRVYLYRTKSKDGEIVVGPDEDGDIFKLNQEITYTTLNYDYKFIGYSVTPYIGAHAGYGKLSFNLVDDDYFSKRGGNTDKQFIYGVQTGIIMPITNNIEFEIGLAYTHLNLKHNLNDVIYEDGEVSKVNWKVDDMKKCSFGINYKF